MVRDVVIYYLVKLFQFESQHKNNLGSQNPKPNPKHIGESRGVEKEEEDSTRDAHVGL